MLKLEKRLDENLMYLRDALPEYSTFDVNMRPVPRMAHEEIPVNKVGAMCLRGKAQDYLQLPLMSVMVAGCNSSLIHQLPIRSG